MGCLGIIAVIFLCYLVFIASDHYREEEKRKNKQIKELRDKIQGDLRSIKYSYNNHFKYISNDNNQIWINEKPLFDFYTNLAKKNIDLKVNYQKLKELGDSKDLFEEIKKYSILELIMKEYISKVRMVPCFRGTRMMNTSSYGKVNQVYFEAVRNMKKEDVDNYIVALEKNIQAEKADVVFGIDPEYLLRCVWFYATDTVYNVELFKKASSYFINLVRNHIDIVIAGLYALMHTGGEDMIEDMIKGICECSSFNANDYMLIASALMWMDAIKMEEKILRHMLSNNMPMSAVTQQRLQMINNGGGRSPKSLDVHLNKESFIVDVSSLSWKPDDYVAFFDNMSFKKQKLDYSLAIRDENRELSVNHKMINLDNNTIIDQLTKIIDEEYGDDVQASLKECIAVSGQSKEKLNGFLITISSQEQLGIFMYVIRIGKKISIKFYTLLMPTNIDIMDQKQIALSLHDKVSPTLSMWESSIRDSALIAIQQLLNVDSLESMNSSSIPFDIDNPEF